jgi:phosphatidate phosphatase APP1
MTYQESYEAREPGSRRRKLAGYLKAANEIRQTYTQQYAPNWSSREAQYDIDDDTPGGFPDAAVVRSGNEEMILFPSYARRHIKRKPEAQPGTIQEVGGEGRDVRDSTGAGDAEFWKQQWNNYEDDNAVVDVDVRGWIYSPHKGQMSRKQRLFIGLARQLVGVQAPPTASSSSADSSRDTSPQRHGLRERSHLRDVQRDEAIAAREAEEILRKGEREARAAARGAYSEKPAQSLDDTQLYRTESGGSMRGHQLAHSTSKDSLRSEASIKPLQKRGSWNQPSDMNPSELAEANARLMARLRHFLAVPMANTPISIFFYNDKISKQRTVYTDAAGHFSMSAALDFVPTHVRILASDKLSATEEVIITASQGISVISDIDDTIKHSAIGSGAREIFRNVFIRDLVDLTIDGVREWYNRMSEMGVKFHYVSNSPWQLYPVISKYFELAGLPPGSFHLKQYSGMLQGIFEPVAERKKVTLDKIARDFPERNFILIGDSGEADLEVYTDFVLDNPGRVVAVFIRDVTTTDSPGFFEPSAGFTPGGRSSPSRTSQQSRAGTSSASSRARAPSDENDPELNAAIAASLRDMEADNNKRSKSIDAQMGSNHPKSRSNLPERKPSPKTASTIRLIDLSSDDDVDESSALKRSNSDTAAENERHRASIVSNASTKPAPAPPKKPVALRSPSSDSKSFDLPSASTSKPQPPKPRRPSSTVNQPSLPAKQETAPRSANTSASSRPPVGPKPAMSYQSQALDDQQSYTGMARNKLWSVYNGLPALRSQEDSSSNASTLEVSSVKKAPPPPPPRRGNRDTASSAASYVGAKASAAWQHAPSIPYHSRPQITSAQTSQPFSTDAPRQRLNRTSTGSTLGGEQYGTKKEQLWRQRWVTAEQRLGEHGVILRRWRVGSDIMGEAERIIKEAEKKFKKVEQRGGDRSNNSRSERR